MTEAFLYIMNMSITASYIALAVMLIRVLFKKLPKAISVVMWALVGIRLIFPFSFESNMSLIPSAETVPNNIIYTEKPKINSGLPLVDSAINPILSENALPSIDESVNPLQIIAFVASVIWLIGVVLMISYSIFSYARVRMTVRESIPVEKRVYICDRIATPFILGAIRPKIYIPSSVSDSDSLYVVAHERAHLARRDHLLKPVAFIVLSVYWFNPLLWVSYVLLCRDIELAADERVIKKLGNDIKREYSEALLNCSLPRKRIAACPLAFGETAVKARIKNIIKYKKPAFFAVSVSVALCIILSLCFLTNPKMESAATPVISYESPLSDFKYRNNYDGGKTITAYIGNDENVVIPAVIDGKPVTEIYEKAFYLNQSIKSVAIPDSVEVIFPHAFANCFELRTVRMSKNMRAILSGAFMNCKKLQGIDLPEGLVILDDEAFKSCFSIKHVAIPASLQTIGIEVFYRAGLESVTLAEGVKAVGANWFAYTDIKEFIAPESLATIDQFAFAYCDKLEYVRINEAIEEVGTYAFYECNEDADIRFPEQIDKSRLVLKGNE